MVNPGTARCPSYLWPDRARLSGPLRLPRGRDCGVRAPSHGQRAAAVTSSDVPIPAVGTTKTSRSRHRIIGEFCLGGAALRRKSARRIVTVKARALRPGLHGSPFIRLRPTRSRRPQARSEGDLETDLSTEPGHIRPDSRAVGRTQKLRIRPGDREVDTDLHPRSEAIGIVSRQQRR